jgi:hypothetical protein
MSHEKSLQVKHRELHSAIDEAAIAAQETTKRYKFEGNERHHKETFHSYDALAGDPVSTIIERSNDPWYKDKTKINIHTQKPEENGEDPYRKAGTEYKIRIDGQLGANTQIQRTNEKGEIVYTHESKDIQLARRLGMVGARA